MSGTGGPCESSGTRSCSSPRIRRGDGEAGRSTTFLFAGKVGGGGREVRPPWVILYPLPLSGLYVGYEWGVKRRGLYHWATLRARSCSARASEASGTGSGTRNISDVPHVSSLPKSRPSSRPTSRRRGHGETGGVTSRLSDRQKSFRTNRASSYRPRSDLRSPHSSVRLGLPAGNEGPGSWRDPRHVYNSVH